MLTTLQQAYADQPVRFLIFPCNQFMHQEPGSNAEIKAFAEQYVYLGPGSNIIMFAKTSLNDVSCPSRRVDACTPASVECCPTNDGIYDYLLSATPPGNIKWNFDKIVVDGSGRPFSGETILHGDALGGVVGAAISQSANALVESQVANESWPTVQATASFLAIASFVFGVFKMQVRRQQHLQPTSLQCNTQYVMLA